MKTWLATLVLVGYPCLSQNKSPEAMRPNLPTKEELSELISKADEKVASFEQAMKTVRPTLDRIDPGLTTKSLDAASTAHTIIDTMQKNGPTGYRLVMLITTLDDLNSNAFRSALVILSTDRERAVAGGRADRNTTGFVLALSSAGNSCNDIAELIMHATLRYLSVEETLLAQFLDDRK